MLSGSANVTRNDRLIVHAHLRHRQSEGLSILTGMEHPIAGIEIAPPFHVGNDSGKEVETPVGEAGGPVGVDEEEMQRWVSIELTR